MSHVIHVWEAPVPASAGEADSLAFSLRKRRAGQNPKFLALAAALTRRFPDLGADGDEDGEGTVWADGPVDGRSASAVLVLGVQAGEVGRALPAIVHEAASLGLVVFDMQLGQVFLPDGHILTLPGQALVAFPAEADDAANDDELKSNADLQRRLVDGLAPLMRRHGFRVLKGSPPFKRKLDECEHEFILDISNDHPVYDYYLEICVNPLIGRELASAVGSFAGARCVLDLSGMTGAGEAALPGEGRFRLEFRVDSQVLLERQVGEMASYLESVIIPLLDRCNTLAALEALVNRPPGGVPLVQATRVGITLAHVIGSPHLQEVVAQQLAQAEGEWSRSRIRELVAVLDRMKGVG